MTTATRTRKPRKTPEQKRAEVRALVDQLEAFAAELAETGEDVTEKLDRLTHSYSERNAMLIIMQRPDVVECHGYQAWAALGRQVRKGEKGIAILAPAGRRDATEPTEGTEDTPAEPGKPARQFFKIAYTFDWHQTEPKTDEPKGA
jgi:hypothetical protein